MKKVLKWAGIGFLIIIGLVMLVGGGKKSTTSSPINTQVQQEQPQAKNNQSSEPPIPGMTAADVKLNLENLGFTCTGPELGKDKLVSWECKEETQEHNFFVEVLGNGPLEILSVQATALNYSKEPTNAVVKDFIGYIASVPYTEADQKHARDWVGANISQSADTVISGVRFTLSGNDRTRILQIAHENSELD